MQIVVANVMMVVTTGSLIVMLFYMLLGKFPESTWLERVASTLILTFLSIFFFLAANPKDEAKAENEEEAKGENSPHK